MASKQAEPPHLAGQLSFLDDVQAMGVPAAAVSSSVADVPDRVPEAPAVDAAVEPVARVEDDQAVDAVDAGDDDGNILTGPNTRVRAGNVMHRARAGAVRGALEAIARRGIRGLTMVEAADRGGLARATLYNHVRDKDALLALVLEAELARLSARFEAASDLEHGLAEVADAIATHPALAGIRAHDAASLASLAAAEHPAVRTAIVEALQSRQCRADSANVDLVLRWLASFVTVSAYVETRHAQASALAGMLH